MEGKHFDEQMCISRAIVDCEKYRIQHGNGVSRGINLSNKLIVELVSLMGP